MNAIMKFARKIRVTDLPGKIRVTVLLMIQTHKYLFVHSASAVFYCMLDNVGKSVGEFAPLAFLSSQYYDIFSNLRRKITALAVSLVVEICCSAPFDIWISCWDLYPILV